MDYWTIKDYYNAYLMFLGKNKIDTNNKVYTFYNDDEWTDDPLKECRDSLCYEIQNIIKKRQYRDKIIKDYLEYSINPRKHFDTEYIRKNVLKHIEKIIKRKLDISLHDYILKEETDEVIYLIKSKLVYSGSSYRFYTKEEYESKNDKCLKLDKSKVILDEPQTPFDFDFDWDIKHIYHKDFRIKEQMQMDLFFKEFPNVRNYNVCTGNTPGAGDYIVRVDGNKMLVERYCEMGKCTDWLTTEMKIPDNYTKEDIENMALKRLFYMYYGECHMIK